MFNRIFSFTLLILSLTACKTGQQQDSGTILGGVAGAAIGSQFGRGDGKIVAGAAGAILGAIIGNKIGKSMDDVDRMKMNQSTQRALEKNRDGHATTWVNPNTQHSGNVIPQSTYINPQGQNCREFTQTVRIGGKDQQAFGKACRQSDGSWKIVQ